MTEIHKYIAKLTKQNKTKRQTIIEETICGVGENKPSTREEPRMWWILKLEGHRPTYHDKEAHVDFFFFLSSWRLIFCFSFSFFFFLS